MNDLSTTIAAAPTGHPALHNAERARLNALTAHRVDPAVANLADATAAIQAELDAAQGAYCVLPSGTFTVALTLYPRRAVLVGSGPATVLNYTGSGAALVLGSGVSDGTLLADGGACDMTLLGANAQPGAVGVLLLGATRFQLEHLTVKGFAAGVTIREYTWIGALTDCALNENGIGLWIYCDPDLRVNGVNALDVRGGQMEGNDIGIKIGQDSPHAWRGLGGKLHFQDCVIEDSHQAGIVITEGRYLLFDRVYLERNPVSASISAAASVPRVVSFDHCFFSVTPVAIDAVAVEQLLVHGCFLGDNFGPCVAVQMHAGVGRLLLDNNYVAPGVTEVEVIA